MGLPHLISIVGAGPGDPELLTIKALNRLKEADVVLYDALVGNAMIEQINTSALKKFVGKVYNDGQNQTTRQVEINNEILHWASLGKKVVRLKTGDPMVFARGAEEIRFCRANNLNYEVVPGVTAGLAGSSIFNIPVSERGKNNMILFYTATRDGAGMNETGILVQIIQTGSPVIVYMGMNSLPKLSIELTSKGIHPSTPVQILTSISQAEQKIYSTTIGDISEFLKENKPGMPSIVIIGKHTEQI